METTKHPFGGWNNPFTFGSGRYNGGLGKEAVALIAPIFTCDYMGAAEYEFGALQKALQEIAKNQGSYIRGEIPVYPERVIYLYAPKEALETLAHDLFYVAIKGYDNSQSKDQKTRFRVRDHTYLQETLEQPGHRIRGGINVSEQEGSAPFFFSVDQEMRDRFVDLMEGKVEQESSGPGASVPVE